MNPIRIFGVKIDDVSEKELITSIHASIQGKQKLFVATLNAEILLTARRNSLYRASLNQADFGVVDSISVKLACLLLYGRNLPRKSGADLLPFILAQAKGKHVLVVLPEGSLSTPANIESFFQSEYPEVNSFVWVWKQSHPDFGLAEIQRIQPEIVLLALGAPAQESWISAYQKEIPSGNLFIGIGGALDFCTRKSRRAPKVFRMMGFEWLWRLLERPKYRARRVFRAVCFFPVYAVLERFHIFKV